MLEIMCPLIDALLLRPFEAALRATSMRVDRDYEVALNHIAAEAARRSGRLAGIVFDWVPVIHHDTRLLGWGKTTYSSKTAQCPRAHETRADPEKRQWQSTAWSELLDSALASRNNATADGPARRVAWHRVVGHARR